MVEKGLGVTKNREREVKQRIECMAEAMGE